MAAGASKPAPLGIERDDVEYIMATFPTVERKDRAAGDLQVWLGPGKKRAARKHTVDAP